MAEAYLILRRRRKLLRVCGHRRVEVLNGYAEILGETEDLGLFKFIKLSLELYELVPGVLENAAFSLGGGGLYRANVHGRYNGTSSAVVASYVRIEEATIGLQ